MIRVTDKIKMDTIRDWKDGSIITIKAGTGAGKSYFIKNILYAVAKENGDKILMLIHRTNCINQFQKEIEKSNKTDTIEIKSYQSIEWRKSEYNKEFNFDDYKYIVCDEFHYFLSDAAFNKTTDISLNAILGQSDKIRVFMSATGDYMKNYINNIKKMTTIDYELPISYNFIKDLTFFNKDETMEKFIEEAIEKNNKGIFFIQSAPKAYELYNKYKEHCLFNCSKTNKYYKYVNKKKIDTMLITEKFNELILITTTALDAGVNINDTSVSHIIIDVEDVGSLIQCIGRRRIQNYNDKINVYIKIIMNKQLGGKETQLKNKIKRADYFRENGTDKYVLKYGKNSDRNHIVYDASIGEEDKCTKKLNELMYFKCRLDITDIDIMKTYGDFGYCKYLANIFGFYDEEGFNYRLIEEEYEKNELEKYLETIIGKEIHKEEQNELVNKVDLRQNGKLLKSYESLNSCFKEKRIPYTIITDISWHRKLKDGKRNPYYGKVYWKIYKLIDNNQCIS